MSASPGRLLTSVWVILSVLTVLAWWVGHPHAGGVAAPSTPITIGVLVMGLVKTRLIIRHFMAVRTAPRWLRLATDGWLVAAWSAILVVYLW